MHQIKTLLIGLGLTCFTSLAFADRDIFIDLYKARLDQTKAFYGIEQVQLEYLKNYHGRRQKLMDLNATSTEDFQDAVRQLKNGELGVLDAQARVAEAQALYDIAVERSRLGVDMPICTSLR